MDVEKRRKLWATAQKNGWSARMVAEALSTSKHRIKSKAVDAAISRGYTRGKVAPAVDAWLDANAFRLALGPVVPPPESSQKSRMEYTAQELIALAGKLTSIEYTPEEKAREFKLFVKATAIGLGLIDEISEK